MLFVKNLEDTDWSIITDLKRLKKCAAVLYRDAINVGDLDCGRAMQEEIKPRLAISRIAFSKCWARLSELDPTTPVDPFI